MFIEFLEFIGFIELMKRGSLDNYLLEAMGNTINTTNSMNSTNNIVSQLKG